MTDSDIVNRLHTIMCSNVGCSDLRISMTAKLAADEIERLRAELVSTTNRLTTERDKARRMYCDHVILHGTAHLINENKGLDEITSAQSLARHLGWDYCNE